MSLRYFFSFLLIVPQLSFANFFNQKPDDMILIEEVIRDALSAKRSSLPQGYYNHAKIKKEGAYETLYSVANEECSFSELFQGKLVRTKVEEILQELVVFSCLEEDDGVNFYRYGPNLESLLSLIHI